jgi:hypothetical protein
VAFLLLPAWGLFFLPQTLPCILFCYFRLVVVSAARMFTARKKIVKEKGAEPDEFEETVAQVCHLIWKTSMARLQQQRSSAPARPLLLLVAAAAAHISYHQHP